MGYLSGKRSEISSRQRRHSLSPVILTSELTPDECDLIKEYVMMLSNTRHPWSKGLPVRYT
jgi:hypothetical protein